jgi:hypothetical protein
MGSRTKHARDALRARVTPAFGVSRQTTVIKLDVIAGLFVSLFCLAASAGQFASPEGYTVSYPDSWWPRQIEGLLEISNHDPQTFAHGAMQSGDASITIRTLDAKQDVATVLADQTKTAMKVQRTSRYALNGKQIERVDYQLNSDYEGVSICVRVGGKVFLLVLSFPPSPSTKKAAVSVLEQLASSLSVTERDE